MTNQYALGYKAGLEAATQVAIEFAENSVEEEVAAIKALPVPEVEQTDLPNMMTRPEVELLIEAAVLADREACAELFERDPYHEWRGAQIANAIRTRTQK